jgi:hypothetical protein
VPAFHLDFTTGQARELIGNRLGTFTRPSSVKNVWNGSQFVQVAADVPALQRDPATGLWGYLHEPAATNLYLNSATPATQTIAVTAQQYTLSFYGTGTLTLSGASTAGPLVGTGAEPNRVSLTFTPSAGNLTLTLSGSISRPQLETGPVATSPIITAGSAVTRAVDTWSWVGADLLSFYRQANFTVVVEYAPQYTASATVPPFTPHLWQVWTAAAALNNHTIRGAENNVNQAFLARNPTDGILFINNTGAGFLAQGQRRRAAMSVNNSTIIAGTTGVSVATVANTRSANMAAHDRMEIGSGTGGTPPYQLNGVIRYLAIFPTALSSSHVAALVA